MRKPDLNPAVIASLVAWVEAHSLIAELWLFGSRAKGSARPDSDVDLAIALTAVSDDHNWPLGIYVAKHGAWKRELAEIVGKPVSFGAMFPDDDMDAEVRATGIRLWARR